MTSTKPHAAEPNARTQGAIDGATSNGGGAPMADRAPADALKAVDPPADLSDPDLGENARTVLERRYLLRDGNGAVVETPRQLFWRVARTVASAEMKFDADAEEALEVARDFYTLMSQRMFLPNSPCLTNAGRGSGMRSACFVLPVADSVEGIYDAVKATALIQKAGGGTGFSFSRIRQAGARVESSGGLGAGPLAFMDVFSKASDSIQQGAFRKGANMGMLRVDHPDIDRFVVAKDDRDALTNFNISVAGYPEGHPDAIDVAPEAMSAAEKLRCRVAPDGTVTVCSDASFRAELDYLKSKVDAGADMIITQMFFDVAVYAAFVTACRQHGIHCPIVPGIMVLQAAPGFKKMTKFCKTRVPPALGSKVDALSDDDVKLKQFGVDFGVETCNQLRALNAPGLHFYTLNLENSTLAIVDKLGLGAHNKTNGNGKHTTSSNGKTADDDAKTLSRPGLVTYAALAALIAAVAVALRSHTRA